MTERERERGSVAKDRFLLQNTKPRRNRACNSNTLYGTINTK